MILQDFKTRPSTVEAARIMIIATFIKTSLYATKEIYNDDEETPVNAHDLWENMIIFLNSLFTVNDNGEFNSSCNSLLEMLSYCYDCLPEMMHDELGKLLIQISNDSILVAEKENDDGIINNPLRVFQKSFIGVCHFTNLETIQSVARIYLDRPTSSSKSSRRKVDIDIEVARITCETLFSMNSSSINDVAIELFPSLCKLMNTQNIKLRKESSDLMSKVDVKSLLTRVKIAEDEIQQQTELPIMKVRLAEERMRADNAERDIQELRLVNSQLRKEVEQLRGEKERLEQQVAVFTEGSAYI